MELEALQTALPEIQGLGASLVAITPELEKFAHSIHRRLNLGFDVLLDHGLEVASQFRLVFTFPDYLKNLYEKFGSKLDEFNGEDAYRLPMPARYVIDQQGVIRSANVSPDYTVRPDPSETISVLEKMTQGRG
ncbi:MAG TPA: redoxin domain-containing protein [Candidatus Aquilonibacter sp.]|nr:redoxin domain-containing protein [Candidatus Aquilonibacter sp.]